MINTSTAYRTFFILLLTSAATLYYSCRKVPKFSDVPTIQYKNITKTTYFDNVFYNKFTDSVVVGIHFKDGDGDLGNDNSDQTESNLDYFVDVYRQTDSVFSLVTYDSINFNGHIPLLAPVSTPGPIEGDLYYTMLFPYADSQNENDTLKFVVKIKDRKGNFSNSVETDPVIIRQTP